ncbi:MAG: hypothetical protein M5U31_09755 [Acidimicrobiia bacterium]|nr:hypothetical protein [Acidimicrobiia bacterium]
MPRYVPGDGTDVILCVEGPSGKRAHIFAWGSPGAEAEVLFAATWGS